MAKQVWTGVAYFVGDANLTSQGNQLSFESMVEEKDVTTWGSGGAKEVIGGLESVAITGGGFVDYGSAWDADREFYDGKRLVVPHSIGPSNSGYAVAAPAYVVKALGTDIKLFTSIGEVLPWSLSASGSSQTGHGAFLYSPASAITGTGNGTAVQVGAVASGKSMLAALHVVATTGSPTLDVVVQSDDNSGMTSATDRITFTQATAKGSQFKSVAGAITDDYWRVKLTFGGTGSITVAVAVGVSLF